MAYPGAALSAPNGPNVDFSVLLPLQIELRNRETGEPVPAVLDRLKSDDEATKHALFHLLNYEIVVGGDSYPFETAMTFEQFANYYVSHDVFVIKLASRDNDQVKENGTTQATMASSAAATTTVNGVTYDFGSSLIAAVHIRPNFPGRSCCVANGAFLAVPQRRRLGAAFVLGAMFPVLAKQLGYKATLFNLVFEENKPSIRLWEKLKYPRVGRVENAGRLVRKDPATGERLMDSGTGKPVEVWSAAVMFSVQLDDAHVLSLLQQPEQQHQKQSLRRQVSVAEVERFHDDQNSAEMGWKFGGFLVAN